MAASSDTDAGLIEAPDGSHLGWSDFRHDVLQPFKILCSPTAKGDRLPTTFLARLQASQNNLGKYDTQCQAWRLDVAAGRGLDSSGVFPPNLLPARHDSSTVLRCTSPRMSREGLPLRMPSKKGSLYELPTAKPQYLCGFNIDLFEKSEQPHLLGSLSATGVLVDFDNADVIPGRTLCCPFLAFEKLHSDSDKDVETAKNACAVTGASCLRGQQQLFHKAFGLQTIAQPPITFTCALNNAHAIINCHYIDDEGNYTMAALCRFNLERDDHFCTLQAWISAIESWAVIYLLPRVKAAISEVNRANPSPPPSPMPVIGGQLSIDTNFDVPKILNALRRLWPMIPWQHDSIGETPINSSIAHCGTPYNTRHIRGLALPRPSDTVSGVAYHGLHEARSSSSHSSRLSDMPPLRTDISLSARPYSRPSIHARRFSCASSISRSGSDGSTTPPSPCRPPSLSPCTPGPEAPVSSKSPMLVLQKRLEVAMNEIQDLRTQVDDLQGQLNGRTEVLERKLNAVFERQDQVDKQIQGAFKDTGTKVGWVQQLEALVEGDLQSPIDQAPFWEDTGPGQQRDSTSGTESLPNAVPGAYPCQHDSMNLQADVRQWLDGDLLVWCLAILLKDKRMHIGAIVAVAVAFSCSGVLLPVDLVANLICFMALQERSLQMLEQICRVLCAMFQAAQAYDLDEPANKSTITAPAPTVVEELEGEDVTIALA